MSITQHSVLFRFVSYRFEQQSRYSSATLLNRTKSVRIVTNPFRFVSFGCLSSDMICHSLLNPSIIGINPSRSVAYSFVFGILSISLSVIHVKQYFREVVIHNIFVTFFVQSRVSTIRYIPVYPI